MATKSQEILLKGNTTNASAVPSSLKVREIAINALDRSLFTNDGNSIVKLYTGTTKWFDVNGNANNALKLGGVSASEYIGKTAFEGHTNNTTIHITAAERTAWNNKWDFNEEVIKAVKVNAAILSDSTTKLATRRKIWGRYFDGSADVSGDLEDVGNIFASGKATIQGDIISGGEVAAIVGEGTPAGVTDYSALTGKPQINGVTLVSGNNTLSSLGIQAAGDYATNSGVTTLLANYADKTFVSNNYASKTAFNSHIADSDIHITAAERGAWNAKWNYDEATIKAVKVTSASSADKLNSSEGTSTIPIYFKNGKPTQCIPSDLFSGFGNAYSSTETSLGITIAGHTRMVVVAYSQTAGSVAWTGITGKPTTFTPSAHTHTASEVSGLPTSLKNPYALTFGSKTYDGSAAATITASDLGALTAHQTIYALTLKVNGTSQGVYNPASAAKTINIAVPTKTSQITNDSGFITSAAIPTALKNPFAVEIKANGVSLGTYDGSKAATFNLSAANVGAANKIHTHTASDVTGLPTKLSAFTNDVGYITGITKSMVEGVLTGDITSHTHSYIPLSDKGLSNGKMPYYVTFPSHNQLVALGYNEESTKNDDEYYLKGLCKWAIDNYANQGDILLIGNAKPNGVGYCCIQLYSNSGKDANTGLPRYCAGMYYGLVGRTVNFRCHEYKWYWKSSFLGNAETATKLQTPRTLWGEPFDGSANVSGSINSCDYVRNNSKTGFLIGNRDVALGGAEGGLVLWVYGERKMSFCTNAINRMEISTNGNILIGTTTDNGYKLQVNGSERVYGDLIVDGEVSALVA